MDKIDGSKIAVIKAFMIMILTMMLIVRKICGSEEGWIWVLSPVWIYVGVDILTGIVYGFIVGINKCDK